MIRLTINNYVIYNIIIEQERGYIMLNIDIAILNTDKVICDNISTLGADNRGLLSQNILSQLRNFVEYIAQKIYANGSDIDPNDYELKKQAISYIKTNSNYRFFVKFHDLLQKASSHYTIDENGSVRLMLKYYEYLLRVRIFLKRNYNLEVLHNLEKFPLDLDPKLSEYYQKISKRIDRPSAKPTYSQYNDRYYIQKIKPFFVDGKIYYEVTYTVANDKTSKFDRVIAFTKLEISDNYAVKLTVRSESIDVLGKQVPIQIIDNWEVSIRHCELNNYAKIINPSKTIGTGTIEYGQIMQFLTETRMSLTELVTSDDAYYLWVKTKATQKARTTNFFDILDKSRELISNQQSGSNVIRYLLHKLNNRILKSQYTNIPCAYLSNLRLLPGATPFDRMPYATSLVNHNPRIYDLLECIEGDNREHEFLARFIRNNEEKNGIMFTPVAELTNFGDVYELIRKFNNCLYNSKRQQARRLQIYKDHVYIKGSAESAINIIRKLITLSENGIKGYTNSVDSWIQNTNYLIDSAEKEHSLKEMFKESSVAMIYGSAGTGKSTLINHISNFFNDRDKVYLANTNPAVDNLRRKVKAENRDTKTIKKFLSPYNLHKKCDILFIDECSTVSNKDMNDILTQAQFKLLVLVGDIYQIESIMFGNWFNIVRYFLPKSSITELTKPYRTTNNDLLLVWERVRNIDDAMLEPVVKKQYSVDLEDSIFEHSDKDEIVLCLNYDGLYGINNVNRFLQSNNPSDPVEWGINIYKINDPILFNESERFAPLIYNNMKGKIVDIDRQVDKIWFEIELDIAINEWDAESYDFDLIGESDSGNSIIGFWVNKYRSSDEDDSSLDTVIPFQIAYAVSIHKAQGLEYNSVKIVITNEVEELITHNIFYTAITRAKEKLKIYWSPETEKQVLSKMSSRNYSKDANLLATMYGLK